MCDDVWLFGSFNEIVTRVCFWDMKLLIRVFEKKQNEKLIYYDKIKLR